MNNNDTLRQLRYALNYDNTTMINIFKLGGIDYDQPTVIFLLKKDTDEGFIACSDKVLCHFLDGLITYKRGPSDKAPTPHTGPLTNNMILKKIRIALELKEDEMLKIIQLADFKLSKYELSALFRREGQKNYRACGDQILRYFLRGLTLYYRQDNNK